jgi:hypothetical protein
VRRRAVGDLRWARGDGLDIGLVDGGVLGGTGWVWSLGGVWCVGLGVVALGGVGVDGAGLVSYSAVGDGGSTRGDGVDCGLIAGGDGLVGADCCGNREEGEN